MFPLHYTASLISQYWDATGYNGIYTHVGGIEAEPVMLGQTINMVLGWIQTDQGDLNLFHYSS